MADNRFFPWFKLELEPMPGAANPALASLASLVPIDRNFYEADVRVEMRYGLQQADNFKITVAGLAGPLFDAIEASKTSVEISLGYYGGSSEQILEGVIESKSLKAGEYFYEATLSGVDKAFHLLQNRHIGEGEVPYTEDKDLSDLAEAISRAAGLAPHREQIAPGPETQIPGRWSFEGKPALEALREVYARLRQVGGYGLTLRDGKLWYGSADASKNNAGVKILTEYSFDNYLVGAQPINEGQGGRRPHAGAEDGTSAWGYDFEMLGDPRLRPGDTVTFRLRDGRGAEVPENLTIESITHDFSRAQGYRCTGRALKADRFLEHVFRAMAPGAQAVGEEVNNLLDRNRERSPTVHVGDVTRYSPGQHSVDARLGLRTEPTMTSPSTQVPTGAEGFTLEGRPLVSPFAWNHCGLVVPVYPGMRAVAVHNRYLREDALVDGFLWTEQMTPPPNQAGDFWLCLPLDVPPDRAPNTSDKAANDLTTGDGKRVIQLKGMRIEVGEGLLEDLGSRPDVGADDELQIEHSSGARVTVKDGEIGLRIENGSGAMLTVRDDEIELKAGGRTMTMAGGKVSVT